MVQAGQANEVRPGTDEGIDSLPLPTYAPGRDALRAHAALTGTFLLAFGGSLIAARRAGKRPPERLGPWDAITAGMATHKIARLIAKDKVTSFVRAPFVSSQEPDGQGEVSSEPRGHGLQFAIGELLTCPYCLGQWVSAALGVGTVAAPRLTRLLTFVYTAETIGDFLQLAYLAAEERASTD